MALVIDLRVTSGLVTRSLGLVEVLRMEPLDDPESPYGEVHTYVARRVNHQAPPVEIEHRYGDGGWKLAEKALAALDIDMSAETESFIRR